MTLFFLVDDGKGNGGRFCAMRCKRKEIVLQTENASGTADSSLFQNQLHQLFIQSRSASTGEASFQSVKWQPSRQPEQPNAFVFSCTGFPQSGH